MIMETEYGDGSAVPGPVRCWKNEEGLHLLAPAKLNLDLLVGPARPDGFHPIDSIVCRVKYFDQITLSATGSSEVLFRSTGIHSGPDKKNTAFIATRRMMDLLREKEPDLPGVSVVLEKRVPPEGGMGGGASDAASVLMGLPVFFGIDVDAERVASIAAGIGSDVPFFLGRNCARMTGRGETLSPVKIYPAVFVVHFSGISCPTADVYRAFDSVDPIGDRQLPVEIFAEPPSRWRDRLENDLELPAGKIRPELGERLDMLRKSVGLPVCLTGSGGVMFIPCDGDGEAREVMEKLPAEFRPDYVPVKVDDARARTP